ncbi:hypothetical protein M426DRAFT_326010 [Hypoxylon sp. CI-4A]|nr:hypothetical protein M426DRAFT_326010 [Hypoxylon sp. CI-4A]
MASDTNTSTNTNNPFEVPPDIKQRLKATYDAIAPKYSAWSQTLPQNAQLVERLEKLLTLLPKHRQLRVLELGCGSGVPVAQKLLSHTNIHVTANDLSSAQIELARTNLLGGGGGAEAKAGERLDLVEGDMAQLTFPDQHLDAVVAFYSLIHLPRGEQKDMIEKIARWLRPGGYLLANFSEAAAEGVVMEKWLDERGWAFWSSWGAEETLRIVGEAGLQVVGSDVTKDVVDAAFLWVVAKRPDDA